MGTATNIQPNEIGEKERIEMKTNEQIKKELEQEYEELIKKAYKFAKGE